MSRFHRAVTLGLGYRGRFLALMGLMWILCGVTVIVTPDSPDYPMVSNWEWPRAIAWWTTGCIAIWAAFQGTGHRDRFGFAALYIMAVYRVFAYMIPFATALSDHDKVTRGVSGALVWGAVILIIVLASGWDEPERFRKEGDGEDGDQ